MAITKTNDQIITNISAYDKEYEKVDSDNGFDEYITKYNYRTLNGGNNYRWRNKLTGEITEDKYLHLYIWFYDKDWNYYPEGIREVLEDWEQVSEAQLGINQE